MLSENNSVVSVIEIKEAVGKLSPAELAEVSAFIESREVDCLEQCGRTADERLKSFDQGKMKAVNGADAVHKFRQKLS